MHPRLNAYRPHVSCIYAEFFCACFVLLCVLSSTFFVLCVLGVRAHLVGVSRRLKHWYGVDCCIVEFFLDISPSLYYLTFFIFISIQYILFMYHAKKSQIFRIIVGA